MKEHANFSGGREGPLLMASHERERTGEPEDLARSADSFQLEAYCYAFHLMGFTL
jgi:hypothetical protein